MICKLIIFVTVHNFIIFIIKHDFIELNLKFKYTITIHVKI